MGVGDAWRRASPENRKHLHDGFLSDPLNIRLPSACEPMTCRCDVKKLWTLFGTADRADLSVGLSVLVFLLFF